MRRRSFLAVPAAALPLNRLSAQTPPSWTVEWDRAVLESAVQAMTARFDRTERMIQSRVGGEYRYHTLTRNMTVHPTRETFLYALLLAETGDLEGARTVLERVIPLQDTDPASKWYGLWGYYLEEPPNKMAPADWNWADFNGATMLEIHHRHAARLPESLRASLKQSIFHAAQSVRRRNVSMSYTNIAVKGTFVTLAAAELAQDADLLAYAKERSRRLAAAIDETGSFAEYNSPTYIQVTLANLTRIRMFVRDPDSLRLAARIEERAWLHLGKHWHASTRQAAGPMSRCYSTDIGRPLWLQKSLGGRLPFATLDEVRRGGTEGEVAILDWRCPGKLTGLFLESGPPREHRELFSPGVAGVTWLAPDFTIGSANKSQFWVQRRPLLAYWGGPSRPARYAQLRFLKDDYDFASALFYSVQKEGRVLGWVNFKSPGGDKHPSLDPITTGEFPAQRLFLRLDISGGVRAQLVDESARRVAFDLGAGVKLALEIRQAVFGKMKPRFAVDESGVVNLDLLDPGVSRVKWSEAGEAFIQLRVEMESSARSLRDFDRAFAAAPWNDLTLEAARGVGTQDAQDKAMRATISGAPAPMPRLSEDRLV